jgi:alkaline phosphatase
MFAAAKHKGYLTGLVATSRITHATPASFYAHVPDRDLEARIAEMLVGGAELHPLGRQVDIALGGGACFFLPKGRPGSCRDDETDLIAEAEKAGWTIVRDRNGFDAMPDGRGSLGTLGLFNLDVR